MRGPRQGAGIVAAVPSLHEGAALARPSAMLETSLVHASGAELLAEPVRENAYTAYIVGRLVAPSGRRSMVSKIRGALRRFFHWEGEPQDFDWPELRYTHMLALRTFLANTCAPRTANNVLTAFRSILRECYQLGQIPDADYRRAISVANVTGSREEVGRMVPPGEVRALFEAAREHARTPELGARNAAMLAVLFGAGLRRAELVGLELRNLRMEGAEPVELRLVGKGNKERLLPLPGGARRAVSAWLLVRGAEPGPLFYATRGSGTRLVATHMADDLPGDLLGQLAALAGVQHLTPHDCRRTYVSTLIRKDIVIARRLAGHSSVATTERYDRRGHDEARSAVDELVFVPFDG